MAIEYRTGDLFNNEDNLDGLAHGCNARGLMGSGIAVLFRNRWPAMYQEYKAQCEAKQLMLGDTFIWNSTPVIFNLITQDQPGPHAELGVVKSCVQQMLIDSSKKKISRIGIPRIGAGIGGLLWEDVDATLHKVYNNIQQSTAGIADLIIYTLPGQK